MFGVALNGPFAWYLFVVFLTGCYAFLLSLSNIAFLRLATKAPKLTSGPLISVLIPARNEELRLGQCLQSLLEQSYQDYEVLVLDDGSTDGTWDLIRGFEERSPRIRGIRGRDLPPDWNGKPFAMQQLAEAARGDLFIFTDADTVHHRDSLSWAATNIEAHGGDLMSGYAFERAGSFGEVIVIPNLYLATTLFMPLWLVARSRIKYFAHAIGQFITFRASAFRAMGGYEAVRREVSEDIHIARYAKSQGHKVLFLDASKTVSCRMYEGFGNAVRGIAKNIFDFFDKKVYPIVILSVFVTAFMLAPPFLLLAGALADAPWAGFLGVGVGIFFLTWCIVLYERRMPWYSPFMYPILFVLILVIAWGSALDSLSGKGYEWKGRIVR